MSDTTPSRDGPAEPPKPGAGLREALGAIPYLLVAMAGACTISGGLGFAWIVAGHGPPPTSLLLLPPGLVVVAIPVVLLRRGAGGTG